ncbi:SDR family NAD(P)-dependent oxidoreductase [Niallia sp. Krafla_26]|uniref:SDR family NAD(P)-dependent oxidoreductase n=1 Tax=Niallia sp. Krafla_26 TaxID=3064703 RepID=UPI003D175E25
MDKIKSYILDEIAHKRMTPEKGKELLIELKDNSNRDIAVIGMECKFSKSNNKYEFFENILNEEDCLITFAEEREEYLAPVETNPYVHKFFTGKEIEETEPNDFRAGYIEDVDKFDAQYFGIPPREAKYMDPVQRVFLETAAAAVEDAGYGGDKIKNSNTGIFVGKDNTSSTFYRWLVESDPMLYTGTWEGIVASRLSYIYNLRGPAMVVDTACSSGLVAVHNAVQSLRNKECDMAIAGGVAIGSTSQSPNKDSDGVVSSVQSDNNEVRSFDKFSTGTIFGEGVGAVLLKPLNKAIEDRDHIYAVIKGSAINNDGASNGITAPNPEAQEDVYCKAWEDARIDPETIGYIEAHGTGTNLGDPIETRSLTNAFKRYTDKKQFCGIGTVKTNIGHTVGASGVAGLIKSIYSLENKKLYRSIHFEVPNPHINFVEGPLFMVDSQKEWLPVNGKRRAGINAFGFSGTNCHVVIEEYEAEVKEKPEKPQLFTVSAKTEEVLKNNIRALDEFFQKDPQLNLNDVCYTANTGRNHFEYCLAIVTHSLEDLKEKIHRLNGLSVEELNETDVYYGYYKIVSDRKENKGSNEIGSQERIELSEQMNQKLALYDEASTGNHNLLVELAKAYSRGAKIDWEAFYQNWDIQKVSLPTYQFDRTHFWGNPRDTSIKNESHYPVKIDDFFIKELVFQTINQDVYTMNLKVSDYWMLEEHSIFAKFMLPGASYPEIYRRVAKRYFNEDKLEFKNIIFYAPLTVEPDEEKEAQIIVNKKMNSIQIQICSRVGDELDSNWQLHTECTVLPIDESAEEPVTITVDDILANEEKNFEYLADYIDREEQKKAASFGERWDIVNNCYKGNDQVVLYVELDEKYSADFDEFQIHASVLDNALNNYGTFSYGHGMHLPLSYKSLKYYAPLTSKVVSAATFLNKNESNNETLTFDFLLFNEDGEVCAKIEEYTMKRVSRIEDFIGSTSNYYHLNWVEQKQEETDQRKAKIKPGNVLIIEDDKDYNHQIRNKFEKIERTVYSVSFGDQTKQLDENAYVIDGTEDSYQQLIEQIKDKNIRYIFHLSSITKQGTPKTYEELQQSQLKGTVSAFLLTKALANQRINDSIEFIVLTENADQIVSTDHEIYPHNNALLGFAKCIHFEYPNINTKLIDMDTESDVSVVLDKIFEEENSFKLGVRKNTFYEEELAQFSLEEIGKDQLTVKDKHVYVITGGAGGMGLYFAKYLASKGNATIALIGRSELNDDTPKSAQKLQAIEEIKELGAEVVYYAADVSNYDQMAGIVNELKDKHGPISGIFHCAGVAGDGYIMNKDLERFTGVLTPKYNGTWILHELTKEDPLDFFVLASSMTALTGAPGQSDYSSANSYLDSFAKARNQLGKQTIAINWSGWSEVGMTVDNNLDAEGALFSSVSNEKAGEILEELIHYGVSNVVTGDFNYEMAAVLGIDNEIKLHSKIQSRLESTRNKVMMKDSNSELKISDIKLIGKREDEFSETELVVGKIFGMVLGSPVIDIYDRISDMGADSIIITHMFKFIDERYKGLIDVADIFAYNSVHELASHIDQIQAEESNTTDDPFYSLI